jgi:transposase
MHNYYNDFFEIGQQQFKLYLYESRIPFDDSVYTLKKIMKALNFEQLLDRYSHLGRTGYNPIMIYTLILYANMRGVRAVDKIVDLCKRDICFIWLAQGKTPGRDVFYDFMNEKATIEILEHLHYQFVQLLKDEGYLTLKTLFLDGTKLEANANRYTFVWRGSINSHLIKLLDQINELYSKYNSFINESNYKVKYNLIEEKMFIVEGTDKVRDTISKNIERKRNNKKKISNNGIVKIDNICPIKLMRMHSNLQVIRNHENIVFSNGSGQKKPVIQKICELLMEKGERLLKYKEAFEIMGTDRNSYSKTDLDATFMRMKEDHMMNGQLKPAYNVQFAIENYFVVHTHVSNDRTDYNTLVPVIEKHKKWLDTLLEEFIADSGYCSEKNLSYLKYNNIESFIKLQEHEKKKTKKYHQEIGKYYNMAVSEFDEENKRIKSYNCHDKRLLTHSHTEIQTKDGVKRIFEVYRCESCDDCTLKSKCLYKYDEEKDLYKNKEIKVNYNWDELKRKSENNILSDKGIIYRQIRSIQTEGSFGDMKHNHKIRHFNHRGEEKVYKEMLFYTFGRNLIKYHRFEQKDLKSFEGKAA